GVPRMSPQPKQPMISIRDLWKAFGSHQVLTGVDLDVEEGSTCVILGGSGSGKTVLMKHIIGLLKPDKGQVIVDGEDIVPLDGGEGGGVRRMLGMVFRGSALSASMTVYENVSFALGEHSNLTGEQMGGKVGEKLAIVGLGGGEDKSPADLSGG